MRSEKITPGRNKHDAEILQIFANLNIDKFLGPCLDVARHPLIEKYPTDTNVTL